MEIKPKSHFQNEYSDYFKSSSFNQKLFNVLNRRYWPMFILEQDNNHFYVNVAFYSSFNQKKIAEFYFKADSLLHFFFSNLNCMISEMDSSEFQKYCLIEDQFVVDAKECQSNTESVLIKLKKQQN